jgi:hypothetical protein
MSHERRCDLGCGWSGTYTYEGDADRAKAAHEAKQHPVAAAAVDIAKYGETIGGPPVFVEREVGCSCPAELMDPDCKVHAKDAIW